jgi:hypothetical protein
LNRVTLNNNVVKSGIQLYAGGGDGRGASAVLQAAARRRNLQAQRRMNVMGAVELAKTNDEAGDIAAGAHEDGVGLYKLNSVYPWLYKVRNWI